MGSIHVLHRHIVLMNDCYVKNKHAIAFSHIDNFLYLIIQFGGGGGGGGVVRSCKILFGLVKFMTAPDRMSGNVWKVFVNTV